MGGTGGSAGLGKSLGEALVLGLCVEAWGKDA